MGEELGDVGLAVGEEVGAGDGTVGAAVAGSEVGHGYGRALHRKCFFSMQETSFHCPFSKTYNSTQLHPQ